MSQEIESLYNRLIAAEDLQRGTKYERLVAIAFRLITARETVHDLRLHGETGVPHQIDVVVGDRRRRVLIEAKDYDKPVDLPIVRNFWGAVEDLNPDQAFIVTTQGFSRNAVKYARAKGIRLAVLRPPRDEEDWRNVVRRVVIALTITGQAGPPHVTWHLHPDDHDKIVGERAAGELTDTHAIRLETADGELADFYPLLMAELETEYGKVPLGTTDTLIGGVVLLKEPTWLRLHDETRLRVEAYRWEVRVASTTTEIVSEAGVGSLVAELVLRTVDDDDHMHEMLTGQQIGTWTFDGKTVVPRL